MPDIRIHRDHALGLTKAREIAWRWAEEVERDFDMRCEVLEGDLSDTVRFQRTGVQGELIVAADHFDLHAKLGFLLGAFARTIEQEILKNLDEQMARAQAKTLAAKAPAAKAAGKASAAKAPTAGKTGAKSPRR